MQRRGRAIAAALVAGAMVLAGGGIAYADDLATVVDVDDLVVEDGVSYIDLGDVECGVEATYVVGLLIERNANLNSGRVYQSGSTITFSTVSASGITAGASVSASAPDPATTVLSATWASLPAGSDATSSTSSSTITVESEEEGVNTGTVAYRASGTTTTGQVLPQNKSVNVRWNVLPCEEEPPADTTEPVVVLTCPSDPVLRDTEQTASWSASDEGGFAAGTVTSGTIELDTSTYGSKTASVPAGFIADAAGNESAEATCSYFVTETDPPVVTILGCPTTPLLLGDVAGISWSATDEAGGSGLDPAFPSSGTETLDTQAVGSKTLTIPQGTVVDNAGNESAAVSCSYSVIYDFAGFFRPVDLAPTVNSIKAGSAVPIKFSLAGDQGLGVIAAGFPKVNRYACGVIPQVDPIEETVNAGGSSLSYDPVADQYVYVWKTDKDWAGSCGTFTLKLDDGTTHTANFQFKK